MDPQDMSPPDVSVKKGIPVLGWLGIMISTNRGEAASVQVSFEGPK